MASTDDLLAAYDEARVAYDSLATGLDAESQLLSLLAYTEAALKALRKDHEVLLAGDNASRQALVAMLDVLEAHGLLSKESS